VRGERHASRPHTNHRETNDSPSTACNTAETESRGADTSESVCERVRCSRKSGTRRTSKRVIRSARKCPGVWTSASLADRRSVRGLCTHTHTHTHTNREVRLHRDQAMFVTRVHRMKDCEAHHTIKDTLDSFREPDVAMRQNRTDTQTKPYLKVAHVRGE
jgi:hypothetical protein